MSSLPKPSLGASGPGPKCKPTVPRALLEELVQEASCHARDPFALSELRQSKYPFRDLALRIRGDIHRECDVLVSDKVLEILEAHFYDVYENQRPLGDQITRGVVDEILEALG